MITRRTNCAHLQVDEEMKTGAQLFSYFKQLLKLYTRQRDKAMMLSVIEEVSFRLPSRSRMPMDTPLYSSLILPAGNFTTLQRPLHDLL